MNMNGSLYANTEISMAEFFNVSVQQTTYGNMAFLMSYAFGCELWAPWSEELGRKWLMQASMALVILFTAVIPSSPNFATVLALRILTGFATAGGSLTLGVAADMYKPHQQQHAVAFIAWGSMLGSALPPLAGGFMEFHLGAIGWKWGFWLIALFGAFVLFLHLVFVPETTYKIALDRYAKKRRETAQREGNESLDLNLYGPTEGISIRDRFELKEFGQTVCRPFKFLFVSINIITSRFCARLTSIPSRLSRLCTASLHSQLVAMQLSSCSWKSSHSSTENLVSTKGR